MKDANEIRKIADQLKAAKSGGVSEILSAPEVSAPPIQAAAVEAGNETGPASAAKSNWPSDEAIAAQEHSAKVIVETITMGLASFDATRASPLVAMPEMKAAYVKSWQAALAEWESKAQLSPSWALVLSSVGLIGMPIAAGVIQKRMTENAVKKEHLRAVPA